MADTPPPAPASAAPGLLPCPFCGSKAAVSFIKPIPGFGADWSPFWRAMCDNGDCEVRPHCDFSIEVAAIAAWNTRAALPADEGERT